MHGAGMGSGIRRRFEEEALRRSNDFWEVEVERVMGIEPTT